MALRATTLRAAFPSGPIADSIGNLSSAWRGFFQSLYARTGGSNGVASADTALVAAERQARIAGDQTQTAGLTAERTARQAADADEALARQAADALLVPKAELCALWAQCDLSFLPTTDPGLGRPWLDGNNLVVGTPAIAIVDIGLEDGTDLWGLEDGTGEWLWG